MTSPPLLLLSLFLLSSLDFDIEPEYATFMDFVNFVDCSPNAESLDYTPILQNLKVPIPTLPSSDEILNQYKLNFLFKSSPMKLSPKKKWKFEETLVFVWTVGSYALLHNKSVEKMNKDDWSFIASMFPSMSPDRCKFKWKSIQKSIVQTNEWSDKEDQLLYNIIQNKRKFKDSYKWTEIAHELNQNTNAEMIRLGKHCRERWYNHLDPFMKKGEWSSEEDLFILESILSSGKKWAKISKGIEGRTENAVKNRFITLVRHYNKINNIKRKHEKTNPLDTPPETIKLILSSLSHNSPTLFDSPRKRKKTDISPSLKDYNSNSPYSSPMSDIEDEIEERSNRMDEEMIKPLSSNNQQGEYRPLIKLQEVKNLDSCTSIFEENKRNFESADSDFKRIGKLKSLDSPKMLPSGISPINFNPGNESIPNLDSHLDISPNVQFPGFSRISEKSQEDLPSMEFLEDKENKQKKKNEILKHSISDPLSFEGNRSTFERMLQRLNSGSKNWDNASSVQLLKTYNSFYSGKSKMSLEHSFGIDNLAMNDEGLLPFLLQHEQLRSHLHNPKSELYESKKNEEKSPIINSLNNLNLSDSPKLLSPPDMMKRQSMINKSASGEGLSGNGESFLFSKKDSCSNFLNLDRTELMNSVLKNLEE